MQHKILNGFLDRVNPAVKENKPFMIPELPSNICKGTITLNSNQLFIITGRIDDGIEDVPIPYCRGSYAPLTQCSPDGHNFGFPIQTFSKEQAEDLVRQQKQWEQDNEKNGVGKVELFILPVCTDPNFISNED